MMEKPLIKIEYKDNKNSSGKIVEGVLHLKISSRLSREEQQRHIESLTDKLLNKLAWARQYRFSETNGIVKKNEELGRLAATINKTYYNFPLAKITFHKQNSTWGTCNPQKRLIYISHRLIGAPIDLLWYVVTHELCHLSEPSHSKQFWKLVGRACPNYQECRVRLKAFGLSMN